MSRSFAFLPVAAFVVLALVMWRGLYLDSKELPSMLIDKPMPAFDLMTVDDNSVTNDSLPSEPFLLNVWGSYCLPCLVEHPTFMRLSESGEIPIVGVNYRDQKPWRLIGWKRMVIPMCLAYSTNLGDLVSISVSTVHLRLIWSIVRGLFATDMSASSMKRCGVKF